MIIIRYVNVTSATTATIATSYYYHNMLCGMCKSYNTMLLPWLREEGPARLHSIV